MKHAGAESGKICGIGKHTGELKPLNNDRVAIWIRNNFSKPDPNELYDRMG